MTDAPAPETGLTPSSEGAAAAAEPAGGGSPPPASSAAPAEAEAHHSTVDTLLAKFDAERSAAAEPPKDEPKTGDEPKPVEGAAEEKKVEGEKPAEGEKTADEKKAEADAAEAAKLDAAKAAEKPAEAKTPEQIGEEAAEAARAALAEAERFDYTKLEIPAELDQSDERLGQAIDILKNGKLPVEDARKLLDFHTNTMKEFAEAAAKYAATENNRKFGDMRKDWVTQVMADPELGGAGHLTAMAAIAKVRDLAVPEAEREAFGQFLAITGAGDNIAFLRMMHRISKYVNEPGMPPPNPKPTANGGKAPNKRAVLYDHPTSQTGSRN